MLYTEANAKLTGRNATRRKLANNTYLERRGDDIAVRLHDTDIVTIHKDGNYTLNSGGWQTMTTKDRINRFGPGGQWLISQVKGIWYLADGSLFYDGVQVNDAGHALQPRDAGNYEKRLKDLKKQIKEYATGFTEHAKAGKLADPSGGDCWGCCMRPVGNRSVEAMGIDHYWHHFEEKYYVPSLLLNAIVDAGYNVPAVIFHDAQTRADNWNTGRLVYKFLLKKLEPTLER